MSVGRGELAFGLTDTDDAIIEQESGQSAEIIYPGQDEGLTRQIQQRLVEPNSGLAYKTENGAHVGDIWQTLAAVPAATGPPATATSDILATVP